jgi:dinuclear metal center YbgI/SA1388 family protein
MQIKEIIQYLEDLAPTAYQESYDNAGLITGNPNMEFTGSICCLDSTEEVIDEAIAKGINLVVAHHPIVFKGLKRFNGKNYVERAIIKAIKNDIAIYAIHTNLDNVRGGVNERIADTLGLSTSNRSILIPKKGMLSKLEVYVPLEQLPKVQSAVWKVGAGEIGNYANCSFSTIGAGTFRPLAGAKPFIGTEGEQEFTQEQCLEVIFPSHLSTMVIRAMAESHPYEQPAYQLITLDNSNQEVGSGIVGNLAEAIPVQDFLSFVKERMGVGALKYTNPCFEKISKVAVLGGSGIFGLGAAIASGAQVFITSDVKYHEFFDAEGRIILIDIGHYESEQYTQQLLQEHLAEKFPKFANLLTGVRTNPVNYL